MFSKRFYERASSIASIACEQRSKTPLRRKKEEIYTRWPAVFPAPILSSLAPVEQTPPGERGSAVFAVLLLATRFLPTQASAYYYHGRYYRYRYHGNYYRYHYNHHYYRHRAWVGPVYGRPGYYRYY
jgi:hypothetical protein